MDPPSVLLFESPTTHTTLTSPRRSTQPTHSTSDRPPMSVGADAAFARGLSQSQDGAPLDLPFTCPAADDAHRRDRRRVAAPAHATAIGANVHDPTPFIHRLTLCFQPLQALSQLAPSQPSQPTQPRPDAALAPFLHPIQSDAFVPAVPCRHTRAQAADGHTLLMLLEDFHDRWVPVLLAYDMHCGWKDCGDCNARDTPSTVPYHKTYREEML